MSWAVVVVTVGSSIAAGYAQHEAGEAAQDAADYNAAVARQRAEATARTMESETSLAHENARRLKAEQRAGYSASGALPTSGTPLLVMMEQAADMELDIMTERHNRMKEIQGLESSAQMSEWEGKQAKRSSLFNVGSTLLSGAGSMAGSFAGTGGTKAPAAQPAPKNLMYRMH